MGNPRKLTLTNLEEGTSVFNDQQRKQSVRTNCTKNGINGNKKERIKLEIIAT